MMYAVEMPSCGMIFLQSFMKISAGFQAILWFCFNNLNNCKAGITDGEEL
jgi:hypothetical protein